MSKNKSRWIPFLEKMRFKYRVSVLNENTLEESWHIRLSRLSGMVYLCMLALISFIILTILIIVSPFRYYLPGYGESNKTETIRFSMRVDSLMNEVELQNAYIEVIKDILSGEIASKSISRLDSLAVQKADLMSEKSKAEKQFTEDFENDQKFNLSAIQTKEGQGNVFVSFKPVKGVISTPFNPKKNFYGVNIITSPNEAVISVFPGTVISASFTLDAGYVIQVQHVNDYVSTYKNNTKLLKKVGDIVKAGESIAITGSNTEDKRTFYFELWKNGRPVDPEDVIIF